MVAVRLRLAAVVVLLMLAAGTLLATSPAQTPPPAPPAEEYSGLYEFLREGESVQLSIEEGKRLTGFVSRLPEDDKGPILDHFFKQASIEGNRVGFTTRKVHGVWYEFQGAIERGAAKLRADEGYYVLHGTLTQHSSDANGKASSRSREVWFKSFPRLDDDPPQK